MPLDKEADELKGKNEILESFRIGVVSDYHEDGSQKQDQGLDKVFVPLNFIDVGIFPFVPGYFEFHQYLPQANRRNYIEYFHKDVFLEDQGDTDYP